MPAVSKEQCWELWLAVKFNLLNPTLKAFYEMVSTCHSYPKSPNPTSYTLCPPHPGSPVPSPFYALSMLSSSHCPQCPSPYPCRSPSPVLHSLVTSSTKPALISSCCIHSWMWSPTIKPRLPTSFSVVVLPNFYSVFWWFMHTPWWHFKLLDCRDDLIHLCVSLSDLPTSDVQVIVVSGNETGIISCQRSLVCAGPCVVQRTGVIDRTLLSLTPPLILSQWLLAAYSPVLSFHCTHTIFHLILMY